MMYARIDRGVVQELFVNETGLPIRDLFPASLEWVACDSSVRQGDRYCYDSGNFLPPPAPSIEALMTAKLEAVNSGKNSALDAGFWHDGVLYDSDYKARLAYLEAATQFQIDPEFSTQWKASTGQWVTMDAALFAALIQVYRVHVQACFAWQAAREAEVAAALALEDEGEIRAALAAISEVM